MATVTAAGAAAGMQQPCGRSSSTSSQQYQRAACCAQCQAVCHINGCGFCGDQPLQHHGLRSRCTAQHTPWHHSQQDYSTQQHMPPHHTMHSPISTHSCYMLCHAILVVLPRHAEAVVFQVVQHLADNSFCVPRQWCQLKMTKTIKHAAADTALGPIVMRSYIRLRGVGS